MAATNRWVVLERRNWSAGSADLDYKVAFYADVPAGTPNSDGVTRANLYANPDVVSAWKSIPAADLTGMKNGSIIESVAFVSYPAGMAGAAILSDLDARHAAFQAQVTAESVVLGDRYGLRRTAAGGLVNTKVG